MATISAFLPTIKAFSKKGRGDLRPYALLFVAFILSCFLNFKIAFKGSPSICSWSFFHIWAFFHEHSRFTGRQEKGEAISLSPLYHFHPLHKHWDISRAIIAQSSLHFKWRKSILWQSDSPISILSKFCKHLNLSVKIISTWLGLFGFRKKLVLLRGFGD